MADSQQHSLMSTLFVEKDLPDPEKSILDGLDGSDDIEKGSGDDVEKGNKDPEKGPERAAPAAVIDWDGPDDPENPHNWPIGKRILHILPPAMISLTA
jgi:hypothetical protein